MSPTTDSGPAATGLGIAATLLCAAAALLFAPVLLGGESFFSRDVAPFFYPMKHYLADSIRSGRLPLWNPWTAGGEPFFASLQPGLLYPGSLILYALPLPFAFNLLVVAHYPLAGVGMYALLRRWGHTQAAAGLGAIGFMAGGFLVSLGNFPNNLQTVAWTPWLFLAWDRVLVRRRLRDALGFSVLCGVAFLGGEPQLLGLALILLLAHSLLRVEGEMPRRTGQLAAFALTGALALGVVAVQLLPFVEYMANSVRALPVGLEYAAARSLEPRAIGHLLFPPVLAAGAHGFTTRFLVTDAVPWLLSIYPGVVVLVFAGSGLALSSPPRRAWFWSVAALVGLLLALGRHSPVYRFLFEALPVLRPFRYPEKFFFLAALALPVLAASGLDEWLRRAGADPEDSRRRSRPVWILLAGAIAAYGLAVLLFVPAPSLERACRGWLEGALLCADPGEAGALYGRQMLLPIGTLAAVAVIHVLAGRGTLRRHVTGALVVACAALDLAVAHRAVNPSVPGEIYRQPPWVAGVLAEAGARTEDYRFRGSPHIAAMGSIVTVPGAWELSNMFLDYQTMGPNVGQLFGYAMQDGLQGVELQSVALTNEAALEAWAGDPVRYLRAMNVRWYADATVEADAMRSLRRLAAHPELPIRVFEVPNPLPRAYLVNDFELAAEPEESLRRSLSPEFPLGTRIVLEQTPRLRIAPQATGRVVDAVYDINRVSLRVRTSKPMLLVLNDRYYPGWKATLLGVQIPILRANGVFRAVAVPAGESEIVFRFRPATVQAGAWISAVTILVMLAVHRLSRRPA